jgi:hypothetical protein
MPEDVRNELRATLFHALQLLDTPATVPPRIADDALIVRPLSRAFAMLGVKKTLGFELINRGILERVKLGPKASGITMRSIRRVAAEGVP